ncbi:MAG TPA: zf-TFIIB domain-containing protein [Segetibacter sp.]
MNCPNCNETLVMTDRQGVEIDYCPKCRGVWLDRGELDKILERTADFAPPPPPPTNSNSYYQEKKYNDQYHNSDPRYKHKKKKGFLDDFFDFG